MNLHYVLGFSDISASIVLATITILYLKRKIKSDSGNKIIYKYRLNQILSSSIVIFITGITALFLPFKSNGLVIGLLIAPVIILVPAILNIIKFGKNT